MAQFSEVEVQEVLNNLRSRYPNATPEDAVTILQDSIWAEEDERRYEAREMGAIERASIYGTDALDELAAEQDECARFRA